MSSTIFRKKSLERIQSPDQLDDYIHVASPGVWMVLAAVVLLLAGGAAWASVGIIEETVPAVLVVQDGEAVCCVAQDRASELSQGDAVRVDDVQGTLGEVSDVPVSSSEVAAQAGEAAASEALGDASWAVSAEVAVDLPDGVYDADVVTSSCRPIALLFGGQ